MELSIRKVEPRDLKDLVAMLHEFAAFEDLSNYCEVTKERLAIAMFGPDAIADGLIALDGDKPVGYALFFPNFSSFRGQLGLYLDDLFISNAYRGKNLGHKMLKEIARIAASRGYERIDFNVLDWNTPAIGFYKKLGADSNDEETHFKFTDEAFRRLCQ